MSCKRASSALKKIDGVKEVATDKKRHALTIVYDDEKVTLEQIREALKKSGRPMGDKVEYLD
ncbi:MAG: cation transporter [Deltaproteobacteria bacterium]|jgi:copper chaperone CopZ|nr:cation transporter [Deltaproteobacteria bacterium]